MNIKGLVSNVIPFPVKKNEEAKAKTALDADNEKDGKRAEFERARSTPSELNA